jgi:hypothetical protein
MSIAQVPSHYNAITMTTGLRYRANKAINYNKDNLNMPKSNVLDPMHAECGDRCKTG